MKKTRISLRGIEEILNERELKNTLGGSGDFGGLKVACEHSYTGDDGTIQWRTSMCLDPEGGLLLCQFWWSAGHECSCSSSLC